MKENFIEDSRLKKIFAQEELILFTQIYALQISADQYKKEEGDRAALQLRDGKVKKYRDFIFHMKLLSKDPTILPQSQPIAETPLFSILREGNRGVLSNPSEEKEKGVKNKKK